MLPKMMMVCIVCTDFSAIALHKHAGVAADDGDEAADPTCSGL